MKFIDYLLHIYYSAFCILLHTYAAFWELHSISPIYLIVFIHCLEIAKEKQVIKKKSYDRKINSINSITPACFPARILLLLFAVVCSFLSFLCCPVLSCPDLSCFVCRLFVVSFVISYHLRFECFFLSFLLCFEFCCICLICINQLINQSIEDSRWCVRFIAHGSEKWESMGIKKHNISNSSDVSITFVCMCMCLRS